MSINGLNPLSYIGVNSPNPAAQIISQETDPTVNDSLNVTIGDIWINQNRQPPGAPTVPQRIFMLTALNGSQATWTEIGATDNVINVLGGTNINVNTVVGNATVNLNPSVVLAGSLNAGTTVTAGTGIASTTGNIQALSGNFSATNSSISPVASVISFGKNRAGGAVVSGDRLGGIGFIGFDGAANQLSALITSDTTGTIAAGRIPSKITFSTTPNAVSAAVNRVVIDENGTVTISIPDAPSGGVALSVDGGVDVTDLLLCTARVQGETLTANGDLGGQILSTSFTDATVANAPGGGTLTINSQSANPGTQAGFIKIYVGTTAAYIPYFTNIAP